MANVNMYIMAPSGEWVPWQGDGGAGGAGPPADTGAATPWSYVAASGGIADTSDVALVAAAGVGSANYLTGLQLMNASPSVDTEVVVKDGATVIWRTYAPAAMDGPRPLPFPSPLISSSNAALNFACATTGSKVYVSAQGYQT